MTDTTVWFERAARASRVVVDTHHGAVVTTRSEFCEAIKIADPRLRECPATVFEHITCALRRVALTSRAFVGNDPSALVIFDQGIHYDTAREMCFKRGLPKSVEMHMLEAALA